MARKKAAAGSEVGAGADAAASIPIEAAMDELTQIVGRLETGQASLDESLQQFERGLTLLRACHQQLDAAAQRIEIVTRMAEDGSLELSPFDATSTLQKSQRGAAQETLPSAAADSPADDEIPDSSGPPARLF